MAGKGGEENKISFKQHDNLKRKDTVLSTRNSNSNRTSIDLNSFRTGGQLEAAHTRSIGTASNVRTETPRDQCRHGGQLEAAHARSTESSSNERTENQMEQCGQGGQLEAAHARSTESSLNIQADTQRGHYRHGGQLEAAHTRSLGPDLNQIKILYSNADSLFGKLMELKSRLADGDTDIIVITESWPKNSRFTPVEAELNIGGYDLHCTEIGKGRGICIYTKSNLKAQELTIESDFNENLNVIIQLKDNDKLLLCAIYRSPSCSEETNEALNLHLNIIDELNYSHKIVLGDFNFPSINWEYMQARDRHAQSFLDTVTATYWTQHIKEATRSRGQDNPSLLDLVFSNEEEMIESISHDSPLGRSDHCTLMITFKCYNQNSPEKKTKYFFNKGNYSEFRNLLDLDWEQIFDGKSVDEQWNVFQEIFNKAQDTCVPKGKIGLGGKSWPVPLEKSILSKIKKKNIAWRRYMETRSASKHQEYTRIRNQVRKATRKARTAWEKDIASDIKGNPKKFWNYVNSKIKIKHEIPELETDSGQAKSDIEKAEALNQHFTSVFVKEPSGIIPTLGIRTTAKIENVTFTQDKIKKKLVKLNANKSAGPDNMHPRVLKELSNVLAKPLSLIFTSSFESGKLPTAWKKANVCALHKKGPKSSCNNYRPVSLTSVVCKTMESIIREDLLDYMISNKLFSEKQFGFIPNRSTILQLLEVLDKWSESLDKGEIIEIAYMDFRKAFDTVPHKRLLNKIASYGIEGCLKNWLQDFFTDRKQIVVVNGKNSSPSNIDSGIPQGSVLGPILFVIFINDLPDNITSNIYLFADDTKIFTSWKPEHPDQNLQVDLIKLHQWTEEWLLKFHPDKCKHMEITRQEGIPPPDLYLPITSTDGRNTAYLERIQEEKDLGITIDNNLKFDHHIHNIVNKANRMMGIIRRTFDKLEPNIFKPLFVTLVRTTLEYGQAVWSPYKKGDIRKIESVQRAATKKINGFHNLSYPERLKRLNLPTLRFRRMRGDAIEAYKIIHQIYDAEVSIDLKKSSTPTRGHQLKLFQERANRLDLRKNSFRVRIPKIWNNLPESVVMAPSLNAFKNRLDKFWENHPILYDAEADY